MTYSRNQFRTLAIASLLAFQQIAFGAHTYFISPYGTHHTPYDSWDKAATNIQTAVDEAGDGDLLLVSNGTYATTVNISKGIKLQSINGPVDTTIDGGGLFPCLSIGNGAAIVDGFTLCNGVNGVNISAGVIQNCIISNCSGYNGGGGICSGGTISNCYIIGNNAGWVGGGIQVSGSGLVVDSFIGGNSAGNSGGGIGLEGGIALRCIISSNSAPNGGGAYLLGGTLIGSLCISNYAENGGGAFTAAGTLNNCTIIHNSAQYNGGGISTDIFGWPVTVVNSILYYNTPNNARYFNAPIESTHFYHCCTWPLETNGIGNIEDEPLFASGTAYGYHLTASSPCIDAGTNEEWMTTSSDIDGQPRIFNGHVDIGSDEGTIAASAITGINVYTTKWDTVVGATCQLQRSDSVTSSSWIDILDMVTSTENVISFCFTNTNDRIQFYRLKWIR